MKKLPEKLKVLDQTIYDSYDKNKIIIAFNQLIAYLVEREEGAKEMEAKADAILKEVMDKCK